MFENEEKKIVGDGDSKSPDSDIIEDLTIRREPLTDLSEAEGKSDPDVFAVSEDEEYYPEPEEDIDDTCTRGFYPVDDGSGGDCGATREFGTGNGRGSNDSEERGSVSSAPKWKKITKLSLKAILTVLRKVATYLLNIVLTVLIVGLITGVVVALAFVMYIKNYVDPEYTGLDDLKMDSSLSTTMYYVDADGNEVQLVEDTLKSSENRLWAEYQDIPQTLVNAYIAVEDMRFREHNGVDFTRTASALYNFFIPTSSSYGGGSTITQQLIKNVSQENDVTIQRKVQEIFRAFNVEQKYTKNEILEMYLNTIYLSHNSYGVRVAADTYFGKELSELTLAECASIASIGKWPTHYDPLSNPKNNLTRRNLVLKLMLEQEFISEEEFNRAYDTPLTLKESDDDSANYGTIHSYYIDAVIDDVIADLCAEYGYDENTASRLLYSGGLQIVTCMDPTIQSIAEEVFEDSSYWPEVKGIQAQSAICIMDPSSGDLLAIVGGLGEKTTSRGLNRATQSKRQCGSSIKPISLYALAIEEGLYNFGSAVDDVPVIYYEDSEVYWPTNSNSRFAGVVSLDYAIRASLNTVAVRTCEMLGIQKVYDNLIKSGYTTLVESVKTESGVVLSDLNLSPLALGSFTYGVTVREHTQAYATLANDGVTSTSRTYSVVRDSMGRVVLDNREEHAVQYREDSMYVLTDLLCNVVSASSGTARNYINFHEDIGLEVAGKTGTTNDKRDVYFCGYTPDLVACCWYGYDNNKVITASGNCAAMLWDTVFEKIYSYYDENGISYQKTFDVPSSIVQDVEYCTVSGKLATSACRNDLCTILEGTSCISKGTFTRSNVPTEYCDVHITCMWDQVTGALCLDGCNCPAGNLIQVGLRKISLDDRSLIGAVKVTDAQYLYAEVPEGYVYPTSTDVPFFYNMLPENISFGYSVKTAPANRICIEHYKVLDTAPEENDPNVLPAG